MNFKLIFIALFIFSSCSDSKKQNNTAWQDVDTDSKLSVSPDFEKLKSPVALNFIHKPSEEDTAGIAILNDYADDSTLKTSTFRRCAAFIKSDSLWIDIHLDNPHGGEGIIVDYARKKFAIDPYHWNHAIPDLNEKTKNTIIKQELTLDKKQYKTGDSVFGKIDLHYKQLYDGNEKEYRNKILFWAIVQLD